MPSFIIDMPGKKPVDITKEVNASKNKKDIKDLKIARENLKGLPEYDKRNKGKFSSLVSKREEELKDLLSKVYNPELDVFFATSCVRVDGNKKRVFTFGLNQTLFELYKLALFTLRFNKYLL